MDVASFLDSSSAAIFASLIAAAIATIGLVTVVWRKDFAERFAPYLAAIAAGLVFATALLLMEDALHAMESAIYYILLGYLLLFVLNIIFGPNTRAGAWAPILAIGIHSFFDGVEYGVLFNFDMFKALVASSGLILHEFAEAIVLYIILRRAEFSKGMSVFIAFLAAAATTPAGAALSVNVFDFSDPEMLWMLTSFVTGALLYVGSTHLIDHVKDANNRVAAVALYLVGVAIAIGLSFTHVHDHGAHTDLHDHHEEHDH